MGRFSRSSHWTLIVLLFASLALPSASRAAEPRELVAVSLRRAVQIASSPADAGALASARYLAGITKPRALVVEDSGADVVLVGERDSDGATLSLRLFVELLRARKRYPTEDPGVTITWSPGSDTQVVHFFAGISETGVGDICFGADWLLKKVALNLWDHDVPGFQSYLRLASASAGIRERTVHGRFWFYPEVSRVNVALQGNLVLLEKFRLAVFTEAYDVSVGGSRMPPLDEAAQEFAQSFTSRYGELAQVFEPLGQLEGATRLAALAKGLVETDVSGLDWLLTMPLERGTVKEGKTLPILSNQRGTYRLSGGARLGARISYSPLGGAETFRSAILGARRPRDALSWGVHVTVAEGDAWLGTYDLPDEVALAYSKFSQAKHFFEVGLYSESAALFDSLLEEHADEEVFLRAGAAHLRSRNLKRASEVLRQLLRRWPESLGGLNNLSLVLVAEGDYQGARLLLENAARLYPASPEVFANRSSTYVLPQEAVAARSDIERAIKLDPSSGLYRRMLGEYLLLTGDNEAAVDALRKAAVLAPGMAEIHALLGTALSGMGKHLAAVSAWEAAIVLDGTLVDARFARAEMLLRLGDYRNALAEYTALASIPTASSAARERAGRGAEAIREMCTQKAWRCQ